MEKLKKLRSPMHSNFTKLTKEIEDLLQANCDDLDTLSSFLVRVEAKQGELFTLDKQILDNLSEDQSCKQDAFDLEYNSIDNFNANYYEIKKLYTKNYIQKLEKDQNQYTSLSLDGMATRRKFKLPNLELQPFNGKIKNWLHF